MTRGQVNFPSYGFYLRKILVSLIQNIVISDNLILDHFILSKLLPNMLLILLEELNLTFYTKNKTQAIKETKTTIS